MTTDRELARQWAEKWTQPNVIGELGRSPLFDDCHAAARYILATLAKPEISDVPAGCGVRPFSSAACDRGTQACVVDHGAAERLTKERDEALREGAK